jgi:hypothetical protein
MSSPRGLIRASLALLLAYALAFAPALAQAARGQMSAMPEAMAAMCLALPDGSGPAPAKGSDRAAHEDCCLAGCRLAPAAAAAPSAELPARLAALTCASQPLPLAHEHEPLRCETPPATGPPARI